MHPSNPDEGIVVTLPNVIEATPDPLNTVPRVVNLVAFTFNSKPLFSLRILLAVVVLLGEVVFQLLIASNLQSFVEDVPSITNVLLETVNFHVKLVPQVPLYSAGSVVPVPVPELVPVPVASDESTPNTGTATMTNAMTATTAKMLLGFMRNRSRSSCAHHHHRISLPWHPLSRHPAPSGRNPHHRRNLCLRTHP